MAFNKSSNPLDPTGRSILTQVAFKGAIEMAAAGKIDITDVGDFTRDFTKVLVAEVDVQKEDFFTNLPAKAAPANETGGSYDVDQAFESEFGATQVEEAPVRILGTQHGPIPAWAVTQFKAAGVTKVFDNRDRVAKAVAEGKEKLPPSFKTPKDADQYGEPNDKGFWAPRGR